MLRLTGLTPRRREPVSECRLLPAPVVAGRWTGASAFEGSGTVGGAVVTDDIGLEDDADAGGGETRTGAF